ncbi:MAG: GNAT family N-acetyltransferase [Planctomycetaceae bacterium]
MHIHSIPAAESTGDIVAAWNGLLDANSALGSPYYRPEFTRAVAAVRDDVRIALFEERDEIVGVLPFQRGRFGAGQPVGGRLNDFHGAIVKPGASWTADEFLRGCRLGSWWFSHLPAEQCEHGFSAHEVMESHYLDLSRGYESYKTARREAGTREIAKLDRKLRQIEREVGPLRFETHTDDRDVFHTLLEWKSEQYRATNLADVFAYPWTVELLERILAYREPDFRGVLSALYADEKLIAVHYGMQSAGVMHSWFPAYSRAYDKYSPGLMLMLKIAEAHEAMGISRIDLGGGREQYKLSLSSGFDMVAEGCVARHSIRPMLRSAWRRGRDWVRSSPLRRPAEALLAALRPMREWWSFR